MFSSSAHSATKLVFVYNYCDQHLRNFCLHVIESWYDFLLFGLSTCTF